MPVPSEIKTKKHIVFWYTSDLKQAAEKLAQLLGGCPCVQMKLGKGSLTFTDPSPIPTGKEVAWLVGHGLATNTCIGTKTHTLYLDFPHIESWCQHEGYLAIVDTCCEPDMRRALGKKSTMKYYCTADGYSVGVITLHTSVDSWWDTEKMAIVT